ncbi:helix-turn-helix domain-containing protein [Rhizobium mongolense]|uniref:Transcriptional regulator with XRE-family HTH domain n=2 Tax=Rhizobium mongolense TaxID=57676 RepID=A0ABR6IP67_9HYPH|nr:helix-turn-helix transcriptional regulator [Rhizobium mongolense]MBB4229309.1 transcriptional regulator with XRE-family HTH domain [Rhizobium mongolense]TVZ63143.1 DNA-binding XRE family transcriptional regulator [Rhizobium mongolense USDA 1844]
MVWGLDLGMFRVFREAVNMSQEKLADLAGISQGKVSKIENGKANPEVATLRALCAALDLEMVLVPRRISGDVQRMIDRHMNRNSITPGPVMSVRDEVFIPDGED